MTYASFLVLFLVTPSLGLLLVSKASLDRRRLLSLGGIMLTALTYTAPWDNYLVAQRVWWYDPARVLGMTLGWVPFEEYLFFLLQPFLTGLLYFTMRDLAPTTRSSTSGPGRLILALGTGLLWVAAVVALTADPSVRYLSLELAWGLPPLLLQFAVGGDLLWKRRTPLLLSLGLSSGYLVAADVIAIRSGIWTISSQFTLGLKLVPGLVLEEAVFFTLTNALVLGGLSLLDEPAAEFRLRSLWRRTRGVAARG